MEASARMSASACAKIDSNAAERWLISRIDIPTPGSASRSRWMSSSTTTGSTAGPAEKLYTRWTDGISVSCSLVPAKFSYGHKMQVEDVLVGLDLRQQVGRRRAVEI